MQKKDITKYLMVFAAVFWAGAFIAGKFSVAEFPPISLTFFRFLVSSIFILPILYFFEKDMKIKKKDFMSFVRLGVIGIIGYHVFFFACLKYTSPVNSSLIAATNPIMTTILSAIFLKEKVKPKNMLALGLSFFGVLLIITGGNPSVLATMKFNIGDLLMLVAVLCWVIYAILSKKVLEKYSPIKVTTYAFLSATIILIPFVFLENPMMYLPKTTMLGWGSVFYMALFASVGGYLIQQISIKKIGPSKTALYVNLVPLLSMILAFFILKEAISFIKIGAAVFIITGVYINTK